MLKYLLQIFRKDLLRFIVNSYMFSGFRLVTFLVSMCNMMFFSKLMLSTGNVILHFVSFVDDQYTVSNFGLVLEILENFLGRNF